jgi:actinin alpha
MKVDDVRSDFVDGVRLLNLLDVTGKEPIAAKWHQEVKGIQSRFQSLKNAKVALDDITKVKKIRLVGIQPEHIVGQKAKMTLGLIWSCINKFMLDKISEEEANARDGLLAWCRRNTAELAGGNFPIALTFGRGS